MSVRFKYLRDPLFLACTALYLLNRLLVKPLWPEVTFARSYLNDLLCIPFLLPGLLLLYRKLGLRRHDAPPQPGEVLVHLVIWSFWFEVLVPTVGPFRSHTVADPWDVVAYSWGAFGAMLLWHRGARRAARARST